MRKLALFLSLILILWPVITAAQTASPTFYYVATTVDANGFESTFSTQVVITFQQAKHIAVLSWTAATVPSGGAAVAGYNIYRGTTSGGPYTKINTALVSAVTYSDTFVLPNAPSSLTGTQQ
jgi:hypothetical protein